MVNVAAGLGGTWAMIRGKPDWQDRLPMDAGAVFGSFWAMALAFPAIALFTETTRQAALVTPEAAEMVGDAAPVPFLILNLLAAYASWGLSLFVLVQLASRSGAGWRVSPLIVAYNWSRLMVNLVIGLASAAAVLTGGLTAGLAIIGLIALVLTVWFDWRVLGQTLSLTPGRIAGALAFVLLARAAASLLVSTVGGVFVG